MPLRQRSEVGARGGAPLTPGWVIQRLRRKARVLYPAGVGYRSPGSAQRHPGHQPQRHPGHQPRALCPL